MMPPGSGFLYDGCLHNAPQHLIAFVMKKVCDWCRREFEPLAKNERLQRFCSQSCRRGFEAAARRWVVKALTNGSMSLDALRKGTVGKRVFPTSHDVKASELLVALLKVESDAWKTLAMAMTPRQFDALKNWFAQDADRRR
jgi:hypothetical protein